MAVNRLTIFEHKCYTVFAFINLLFFATDGQTGLPVGSKKHIQFCRPSGQFEKFCFFKLPFLVKRLISGGFLRYCFSKTISMTNKVNLIRFAVASLELLVSNPFNHVRL